MTGPCWSSHTLAKTVLIALPLLPVAGGFGADRIVSVKPDRDTVPRFERLEVVVELEAEYQTPFDPRQVAVDGHFLGPAGEKMSVPGFFAQDFSRKVWAGRREVLTPINRGGWKVRFTPTAVGNWRGHVSLTTPRGTVCSEEFAFKCTASKHPGFVRVAKANPLMFECDDGSAYLPIGHNLFIERLTKVDPSSWSQFHVIEVDGKKVVGLDQYERWLDRMAAVGCTATCVNFNGPTLGVEGSWAYRYNQRGCWKLDQIVRMCEERGIRIKVVVEHIRYISTAEGIDWGGSMPKVRSDFPYYYNNGGTCRSMRDLFVLPAAHEQFQAQLRYIVARWGYSPSVLAWQTWAEVNCPCKASRAEKVAWTDMMNRYLRSIDPWQHLVTAGLGSGPTVWDELWKSRSIDFIQLTDYARANKPLSMVELWSGPVLQYHRRYGKPLLIGETGMVDRAWGCSEYQDAYRHAQSPKDKEGVILHNAIWAPFFAGASGTAMHWWWAYYIDAFNLYHHYRPFVEFTADVPWNRFDFAPLELKCSAAAVRALARGHRAWGIVGWLHHKENVWKRAVAEGKTPGTVTDATVTLDDVPAGNHELIWFDSWKGGELSRVELEHAGGALKLTVPAFSRDVAFKLRIAPDR